MTYAQLLGELDSWFAGGVQQAGPGVVLCRRGCAACCHGPFDISPADAELVAQAVSRLDAASQAAITSRANAQVAAYAALLPEWAPPWDVDLIDEEIFDALTVSLANEACPALNEHGECQIYHDRPATCRIIGLPMGLPASDVLENECPILDTSAAYAALSPVAFNLPLLEDRAENHDMAAMQRGWCRTTVAGAVAG